MGKRIPEALLQQTVENMCKVRGVLGAAFSVENGDKSISWLGGSGNIGGTEPFYITSVTKLCVTALILRLRSENQLQLNDRIAQYLDSDQLTGLHVLNGIDYTEDITIQHLLAHTSGIPDYLAHKQADGITGDYALNHGIDESWPLDQVLAAVRSMKPKFKPGVKGKAHYSNTNYRLLGTIAEAIVGKTIGDAFRDYLFDPLKLSHTYAYQDIRIPRYRCIMAPGSYTCLGVWLR